MPGFNKTNFHGDKIHNLKLHISDVNKGQILVRFIFFLESLDALRTLLSVKTASTVKLRKLGICLIRP